MLYPLHALNSNLILLIHFVIIFEKRTGIPFKFQSDSINTVASSSQTSVSFPLFKFQSDSINTEERSHNKGKNLTLNSNLILLILFHTELEIIIPVKSLNSNLILLILGKESGYSRR